MAKKDKVVLAGRELAVLEGADVSPGRNRVWHLAADPNDPRRVPAAEVGFSLNEDDPEQEAAPQNPVV